MGWAEDREKMVAKGWDDGKIQAAADTFGQRLVAQGAAPEDFQEYFGKAKEYDPSKLQDYFKKQITAAMPGVDPVAEAGHEDTVINAIKSGLNNTIRGVVQHHGESPSTVTENSPWYNKAAQGIAQGIGDLPVYAASGAVGAMAGTFVGGPVGAGVGGATIGMALPQALRAGLVQAYKQGGLNNPGDYWRVAKEAATEAGKGAITGLATLGTGALGRAVVQDLGGSGIAQTIGKAAGVAQPYVSAIANKGLPFLSEIAGMTAAGSALEGKMPTLKDFGQNAAAMTVLHGVSHTQEKLMNTYESTGIHPADVVAEVHQDPQLKLEMLAHHNETPRALKPLTQDSSDHSTHAVVDGKLIPADEAAKRGELNFKGTPAEFAQDAERRFDPAAQAQAARLHDPAAFKQLEALSELHKDAMGDGTAPDKEKLKEIQARYKELEPRLLGAWEKANGTLTNNLKDRIVNSTLSLGELPHAKVMDHFNPDFNSQADHNPDLNTDAKHALVADQDAVESLKGANEDFTAQDGVNKVLQEKGDLGYVVAPHLFDKDAETGKVTPKPLKIMSGLKRQTSVPKGLMLEKAMWNKINAWDEVYRNSSDPAIKNMPVTDRVSSSVLHANESMKRAMGMVKDGVFNMKGEKTSPGLNELYDRLKPEQIQDAEQYLLSHQVIDDVSRGLKTQQTAQEAKAFIDAHPEFKQFQKDMTALNNAVLNHAVERGYMSREVADKWIKERPNYVPGFRVDEEGFNKFSGSKDQNPFKTREGSELPYLRPYEAMQRKFANVCRAIEINDARNKIEEHNDMLPDDEKVAYVSKEADPETDQEAIFSRTGDDSKKLKPNQIGYRRNGEYRVMTLKDPDLARFAGNERGGAQTAEGDVLNSLKWMLQPLKWPAKLTRTSASLSSTFTIAHIIRAEGFSWFTSERGPLGLGRLPFIDTMRALPDVLKNTNISQEALRSGAYDGMITPIDETNEDMNKYMSSDKYGSYSATHNVIKSIWSMNHEIINQWTKAQRLSEYRALRSKNPNASFSELQDMGAKARRVTVDAMRTGAAMNFLSSYIPFYQYEVQGAVRGVEAVKENPLNSTVKLGLLGTLSMLAVMASKDHDEIQEQPEEMKRNYWMLPAAGFGDGILRIPKPWGLEKTACSAFEAMYKQMAEHDPHAFDHIGQTLLDTLPIPKLPAAVDAGLVMHSNFNTYTGRQYMNNSMMKLAPEDRAMPYTSETARLIAKGMGSLQGLPKLFDHAPGVVGRIGQAVSPLISRAATSVLGSGGLNLNSPQIVDYAIRQFGGTQGQMVADAADAGLAKFGIKPDVEKPSMLDDPSRLPYVGALMARNPTYNGASFNRFKEEFTDLSQKYQSFKEREGFEADKYEAENPEIQAYDDFKAANKVISGLTKELREIDRDKDLSPSDKKQLTDDKWKTIIATAKQNLDDLDRLKKKK